MVLMVHSQTIENRLFASFPDAAVLTDVERRYRDRMEGEIEEFTKDALQDRDWSNTRRGHRRRSKN
jgi:hypothetical protein